LEKASLLAKTASRAILSAPLLDELRTFNWREIREELEIFKIRMPVAKRC